MKKQKDKNIRRNPRVEFKVTVHAQAQSRLQQFYSTNISKGGIFLEVAGQAPDIGTMLYLKFDIPSANKSLEVSAEVIYVRPFETMDADSGENIGKTGVGLKFVKLNPEDEKLITEFVSGKDIRVSQ